MADNPGAPRARGRGKARGRARPQDAAAAAEAARRPGQEPQQPPPQQPPPESASYAGAGNNGGGRRMHRGVPRSDPVPPPAEGSSVGVQQLAESMKVMGLDAGGRGRSREGYQPEGANRTIPLPAETRDLSNTGRKVPLVANFFEVLSRPSWAVYQYHVDFAPIVESSSLRRAFMREHKNNLGEVYLFDGMSDLKILNKIDPSMELFSTRRTDEVKIRITFKFVAELAPSHPELGRLFNTQMRRNLDHLKYQLIGRHFFDQNAISEIPEYNVQVWQGVVTSIRQQEEKLLMSVDTTHKVIRRETALQVITQAARESRDGNYKDAVTRDLAGSIVMTRYNNRTYSVEDIDWSLNPSKTFESKNGPLTYMQYYKQQYDIDIKDTKQPLLLCKSKEREIKAGASVNKNVYLVPELCSLTGIPDKMRADFNFMRELANKTRLDPNVRVKNLSIFISRMNANEKVQADMKGWGISFANSPIQFDGRVLPPEDVHQGQQKASYQQVTGDFSRVVTRNRLHMPKGLTNWIMVYFHRDEGKAEDFLNNLTKVCPPMGMQCTRPKMIRLNQDRTSDFIGALRENIDSNTQLVCALVPSNKKDRYDAIKKTTCLDFAVPSQVIVSRTLNKKQTLMSVATKIGIQINCKLGGEPWAVEIPIQKKALMVIGFDTYHDSAGKGRSAGAFVASLNQNLTRWYSKVTFHKAGGWEEISNHVRLNFTEALKKYQEVNNCLPDIILYYRDGVGDGQIRYVIDWEVNPLERVIKENLSGRNTTFAFIVVNKKVNAKFFQMDQRQGGYSNPCPGTVIDHTVTRYDRYDFFLVSQSVRQGTVSPTMYNVIHDSTGLKPVHIQRMSYKLTHLYFNWPGTIRVPAPCQYAHKLAFLAGQSLHHPPREELSDTLFYL